MPSIRSWGRAALVPFNFSGSGQLDEDEAYEVMLLVPEAISIIDELGLVVRFSEFWAPATAAASSGQLSSDSGGGSTSGGGGAHNHRMGLLGGSQGSPPTTWDIYSARKSGGTAYDFYVGRLSNPADMYTYDSAAAHQHSTPAHQHTVPGHGHGLTYGVFKETLPGSFNVQLTVYRRALVEDDEDPGGYQVIHQTNLTEQENDLDLARVVGNAYLGPGLWRLAFQSNPGQPNNGRLSVDVAGYALGSIAST